MSSRNAIAVGVAGLLAFALPVDARPPKKSDPCKGEVTLKDGDSLYRVANRHDMTVRELRALNALGKRVHLSPGGVLKVKKSDACLKKEAEEARRAQAAAEKAAARKAPRKGARKTADDKPKAVKTADKSSAARGTGEFVMHKVRRGDSLWRIADKYDVTIGHVVSLNRLGKKGRKPRLHPGLMLRIKRRGDHRLIGGVQLPNGPGYLRTRPDRGWGTPGAVATLQSVYAAFMALHPDSVPAVVADLSTEDGGYLPPHHSHQRGVDVDIGYYKRGNQRTRSLEVMTAETLDVRKTWDVLRLFLNTGHVSVIFMDYDLQRLLHAHLVARGYDPALIGRILQYPQAKSERSGFIRHSPGHHHHFHVRFDCVQASDPCTPSPVAWIAEPKASNVVAAFRGAHLEPVRTLARPVEAGLEVIARAFALRKAAPASRMARYGLIQRLPSRRPAPLRTSRAGDRAPFPE